MITRSAVVGSRIGLHARPAALFSNAAAESDFDITVTFDGEEADAASALDVMGLGAMHGDTVTLSAEEDEAAEVLDRLVELVESDLDN